MIIDAVTGEVSQRIRDERWSAIPFLCVQNQHCITQEGTIYTIADQVSVAGKFKRPFLLEISNKYEYN